MGNYLTRDQTSKTIYYLITKIHVFTELVKLLVDNQYIYGKKCVRKNFYWFANKLISITNRFKLT
jgi:hypothetical protein